MDQLRHTFSEWIKSGNEKIPPILEKQINKYESFHTPKAIYCGILLIIFVVLSIILWTTLIKRSREKDLKWRLKEIAYFIFGIATVSFSLLMMVVVVANLQGAFAPLTSFLVHLLG
jgi:cytochrome bd-type quinol oxidase subunit 2